MFVSLAQFSKTLFNVCHFLVLGTSQFILLYPMRFHHQCLLQEARYSMELFHRICLGQSMVHPSPLSPPFFQSAVRNLGDWMGLHSSIESWVHVCCHFDYKIKTINGCFEWDLSWFLWSSRKLILFARQGCFCFSEFNNFSSWSVEVQYNFWWSFYRNLN